ncbi:hypothetical protein LTR41_002022 [Exophiala xenobiotica]|nr:hypothetical protein LTR41_002022 [Exophiala xenobiotica]
MDDESPILLTSKRISSLLRSYVFDPEVLEAVQDTLRRVENLLHRCSGTHSPGRGLTANDPVAPDVSVASVGIPTEEPQRSADFQTAASSRHDLPTLLPDTDFDTLPVEINPTSASTVTTIGLFFDYDLYASDQPALVEVAQQQEDTQREGDQGRDKHNRINIVRENANEKDVFQVEEATIQGTHAFENQEMNEIHATVADEIAQALVNERCSGDGSRIHAEINIVDPVLACDDRITAEHVPQARSNQILGDLPQRTSGTQSSLSRTAGRQERSAQDPPSTPDQLQRSSVGKQPKRKRQDKLQGNPANRPIMWPHVAPIDGKAACLDEVLQRFTIQAGKFASQTKRMQYLADLYIYFGGPHAFQQIRDAFSALCGAEKMDCTTVGGRVRALANIDHAHHLVRRAVHLGLYLDRKHETTIAEHRGEPHPDRTALHQITCHAYPHMVPGCAEFKGKKANVQKGAQKGQNWFVAYERCSSALWLIPKNVSDKKFEELPCKLVEMFFDFLRDHRGHFLGQIDELLGSHVADFVTGRRPYRPIPFEAMTTAELAKHPRDSEHYVDISRLVASSMAK